MIAAVVVFAVTAMAQVTSEPLTLSRAIERALTGNPDALESEWRVDEAAGRAEQARSARLPVLKTRAAYDASTEDQRLFPATANGEAGVFGPDVWGAELVLSLPLYTGGRVTSEIKGTELLRLAAEGQLARTREGLIYNVTALFYGLLAQKEVIASVESAVQAMEEQRRSIAEQMDAQKAARVDLLRAEVRLAALREILSRERNGLTAQQRAFAAVLGWESPQSPEIAGELRALEAPSCPDAAACLRQALARRVDYAAARHSVAAQERAVESTRAGYRPTVSLQAAYGERWMPDPAVRPAGADEAQDVGRIGLVAEWPLFEGGLTAARVREQTAKLNSARERVRKLELQVRYEVETALADITSARERVAILSQSVEQARESFRLIKEKYDLGKGTLTDVLDAQSAQVLQETAQARAFADLVLADARRKLAVGDGIP
ncbi:MAG: TolC family protein [Kiritimatiellia bacterium]